MLVLVRHERATDFLKNKNHAAIWKEITTHINTELLCNITSLQATNKYSNLKRRWKEIVDSKSGSQTKYFRHRDAFDEAYGTRASTKPSFLIDSGSKEMPIGNEDKREDGSLDDKDNNKVTNIDKKKTKTPSEDQMSQDLQKGPSGKKVQSEIFTEKERAGCCEQLQKI